MGKGNPNPEPPSSRGIPSDESLWLPRHYGKEIKDKGGLDEDIIWGIEDTVDFIFPRKYQPKYHKVAVDFLKYVLARDETGKDEISRFLEENKYSRSTLENKVIPKLVKFGLLKRERGFEGGGFRSRSLVLSDSLTFSNYLFKIGQAWKSNVVTARHRRKKLESTSGGDLSLQGLSP